MNDLGALLERGIESWMVPGAVALVARRDQIDVQATGFVDVEGSAPMARDTIFTDRLHHQANSRCPAVMTLVDDGRLALDDHIATWLPKLSAPMVVRHPGDAWLYNTCSDLQGVLVARVSKQPLAEFLSERIFEPLHMVDTGFVVPTSKMHRFTSLYRSEPDGLHLVDGPDGVWSRPPAFPSGAGGLVSAVDDWHAFAFMLMHGGTLDGTQVLTRDSVNRMTTNHLTADQRAASALCLEGQGWGYEGGVDVNRDDPWTNSGRYGWVGGTGTTAYLDPARDTVSILFTQLEMSGPTSPTLMRDFWQYAADLDQ